MQKTIVECQYFHRKKSKISIFYRNITVFLNALVIKKNQMILMKNRNLYVFQLRTSEHFVLIFGFYCQSMILE